MVYYIVFCHILPQPNNNNNNNNDNDVNEYDYGEICTERLRRS